MKRNHDNVSVQKETMGPVGATVVLTLTGALIVGTGLMVYDLIHRNQQQHPPVVKLPAKNDPPPRVQEKIDEPKEREFPQMDAQEFPEAGDLGIRFLKVIRKQNIDGGFEYSILVTFQKEWQELGEKHFCDKVNTLFEKKGMEYIKRLTGDAAPRVEIAMHPIPLVWYHQWGLHNSHQDTPHRLLYTIYVREKRKEQ